MTKLNIVLLIMLVASALYLVQVSYESRRLYAEIDREETRALQLESDRERLQIEARAQATPLRVEKVAREKLGMRPALPSVTEYVAASRASATAPAAAGPAVAAPGPEASR